MTDLKSLICAFENADSDQNQKELVLILKELDDMVGLKNFKEQLVDQILFFILTINSCQ